MGDRDTRQNLSSRLGICLFQLVQDASYIHRLQTPVDLLPDHHHGSKSACTYASQAVKGKFAVRSSFTHIYSENPLELLQQLLQILFL